MKRFFAVVATVIVLFAIRARGADLAVTLSSRVVDQSMRSVLIEVGESAGQAIDEVRIDLPRDSADTAILQALSTTPVYGEVVSRSINCQTVLLRLGTFTFASGTAPGHSTALTASVSFNPSDAPGDSNI